MITQHDIVTWYPTLHKSTLTPPAIIFPIVWFMIYCMIALSGYVLWQYRHQPKSKLPLVFYVLQMILNWAWSPLFFYFHWIGESLLCLTAMIILTLITILITRRTYKLSCVLLYHKIPLIDIMKKLFLLIQSTKNQFLHHTLHNLRKILKNKQWEY